MTDSPQNFQPQSISAASEGGLHNLLVPGLLALLLLATAAYFLVRFTHHKDFATGSITATTVFPIHHAAPSGGVRLANAHGQEEVYILPVVGVTNHVSLPLFIESIAADVTTADGVTLHCNGAQLSDFQPMYAMYPALAQIETGDGNSPLQRDTRIESNSEAHGLVMVHFPISQDAWAHRQSAAVTVSFYHQPPITIPFPAN